METEKIIHKNLSSKGISYELTLCLWAGLLISLSLIGFFLIMKELNLYQVLAFRYFNFVILLVGIAIAFNIYHNKLAKNGIEYLAGLKMGLQITVIAVIPFVIFMAIYLMIDEKFMMFIRQNGEFGNYLSPISAAGVVAIEGFVGGAITTYMAMQYFKDNSE